MDLRHFWRPPYSQGPTSTRYSNRTRIFLYYSNPTRKFLKNDRVASSMYSSHFRKIAALPWCSKDKVSLSEHQMPKAEQGMKLSLSKTWFCFSCWNFSFLTEIWSEVIVEISSFKIFKSKTASKTRIYFQHINVFVMLLTIIMTMVMMTLISAMMIITKCSLPTTDFATRYSTRYSDFLLQPYSNPTRSQKSLLVGACW